MMSKHQMYTMILAMLGIGYTYAEPVPWTFTPSSQSHTIFLAAENLPTVDQAPIALGDYIGVFFLGDNQQFQNAGFTQWQGNDTFITAYGDDGLTGGFQADEEFQFRIWRTDQACEVIEFEAEFLTGGIYLDAGRFQPNGISGIAALTGSSSSITYGVSSVCRNSAVLTPSFPAALAPVDFSSSPGLQLDPLSGAIDPGRSMPGTYLVSVTSGTCLVTSEFTITINAFPTIDLEGPITGCGTATIQLAGEPGNTYRWSTGETSPTLEVEQSGTYSVVASNENQCTNERSVDVVVSQPIATGSIAFETRFIACRTSGRLAVDIGTIQGGIAPFIFSARNTEEREFTSANGQFDALPEGNYTITITDSLNCASTLPGFEFRNTESCQVAVLTPNNDGSLESLFIEESGLAQVFDRNGIVRRELAIPAYWDGRSETGNLLPMGTYLVVVNGRKKMTVTIVR